MLVHELAHITLGHLGLRRARWKAGSPLRPIELQALEMDADYFATTFSGMGFFGPHEWRARSDWLEQRVGENATALYIAILGYLAFTQLSLRTDWDLEALHGDRTDPPMAMRRMFATTAIAAYLKRAEIPGLTGNHFGEATMLLNTSLELFNAATGRHTDLADEFSRLEDVREYGMELHRVRDLLVPLLAEHERRPRAEIFQSSSPT